MEHNEEENLCLQFQRSCRVQHEEDARYDDDAQEGALQLSVSLTEWKRMQTAAAVFERVFLAKGYTRAEAESILDRGIRRLEQMLAMTKKNNNYGDPATNCWKKSA